MFNLEKSIKQWLKLFAKHRAFDHGSMREMELHLRDHIDDLISDGHSEHQAFDLAVEEFGEVPSMADEEFLNIKRKTTIMSFLHTRLLNNYFKTSIRSLIKNPLTSFINVFGLAVAIGICMVAYTFFAWDSSIDRFHEFKDEVYVATYFLDRDGVKEQYGLTPTPLGAMLKEDFSNIKKVCRVQNSPVVLKYGEKVFHETAKYVDKEFLEMFTFPLKWGVANSLQDMNSIILSENISIKYFGEENPIGQDIIMIFGPDNNKTFKVTGVAEQFPKAHIIDFDFLINFENFRVSKPNYDLNDWSEFVNATLIQVENPSDLQAVKQGMGKYKALQNKVQKDWAIDSFAFEKLADLHLRSGNIRNGISFDGNKEGRTGMPIIAIFMLALACFNYINIAIVSAAKRLKEIGLRKVIGANRGQVIFQFLAENIFITTFALVLGVILGVSVFLPWFIDLSGWDLELNMMDANFWFFLLGLLLFTGVASGIYPAFYISRFDVIKIFKGSVQFGKKNLMTKVFLGAQLVLACLGITGAIVITQNNSFQAKRAWGYNQKETLYVKVPNQSSFDKLNSAMNQDPNVLSTSGSSHHLGEQVASTVLHRLDMQREVQRLSVGASYFETMGLELKAGRTFKANYESDKQALIVNELLVKEMGLENPVGEIMKIDSVRFEIIGVAKDFHTNDFFNKVKPTILKIVEPQYYRYLSMKVRSGTQKETYDNLKSQWAALFPEIPFQGGHQEDVWGTYFETIGSAERFNKALAYIAVLLASLGLYGLVTLNVSGRIREFSIRKTLGAGIGHIATIIFKQYIVLSIIALVIAAPISYVFIEAYLDMLFYYPMPMDYSGVAISMVLLIVVLLTVISTQIRKVSKSNPVDGLKVE